MASGRWAAAIATDSAATENIDKADDPPPIAVNGTSCHKLTVPFVFVVLLMGGILMISDLAGGPVRQARRRVCLGFLTPLP